MPTDLRMLAVVPWIAISERFRVIAAAPMGLRGEPPGQPSKGSGGLAARPRAPTTRGDEFALNESSALPGLAGPADRDRIPHGGPDAGCKIEPAFALPDNDCSGRIAGGKRDKFACARSPA